MRDRERGRETERWERERGRGREEERERGRGREGEREKASQVTTQTSSGFSGRFWQPQSVVVRSGSASDGPGVQNWPLGAGKVVEPPRTSKFERRGGRGGGGAIERASERAAGKLPITPTQAMRTRQRMMTARTRTRTVPVMVTRRRRLSATRSRTSSPSQAGVCAQVRRATGTKPEGGSRGEPAWAKNLTIDVVVV